MAGVQLVDNLAAFTDAAKSKNKTLTSSDKNIAVNPFADAGALSRDTYFAKDPNTGSYGWKAELLDSNPSLDPLSDTVNPRDSFHEEGRSFIRKDEKGFSEADFAEMKLMELAKESWPNPKVGAFSLEKRPDFPDVERFYNSYYRSLLVDPLDFVSGPTTIGRIFPEPAAAGDANKDPNVEGTFPSQGVAV